MAFPTRGLRGTQVHKGLKQAAGTCLLALACASAPVSSQLAWSEAVISLHSGLDGDCGSSTCASWVDDVDHRASVAPHWARESEHYWKIEQLLQFQLGSCASLSARVSAAVPLLSQKSVLRAMFVACL